MNCLCDNYAYSSNFYHKVCKIMYLCVSDVFYLMSGVVIIIVIFII